MVVYRADWILPIGGEPRPRTWVGVDEGRIVSVGPPHDSGGSDVVDLGRVAVLPGLVNAHTHLELSYLHGAIPPVERFTDWIREVMRRRRERPDPADSTITAAASRSIGDARAAGTALIGDISNTLITVPLLGAAALPAVVFYELMAFNPPDPDAMVMQARKQLDALRQYPDIRTTLAAHAPYSVSPSLFAAIRSDLEERTFQCSSVHLGESPQEVELIRSGGGPWRILLEELGVWTDEWRTPGVSPVEYLDDLGFLGRRVLAVHGVYLTGSDLARLRALDATVVSCPRSNRHVGVGAPPIEAFYAMGVRVAFGTDSLASVDDLNLFAELAEARRLAPRVSARVLLESATRAGARALGFEREFGSIEVGKRAALIAVPVPEGVGDVEEYLVSGFEPERIQWLDSGNPTSQ